MHIRYRPTQPNLAGYFLQLTDFLKFGSIFGGRIFPSGFLVEDKNSADPDIQRRPGTLSGNSQTLCTVGNHMLNSSSKERMLKINITK